MSIIWNSLEWDYSIQEPHNSGLRELACTLKVVIPSVGAPWLSWLTLGCGHFQKPWGLYEQLFVLFFFVLFCFVLFCFVLFYWRFVSYRKPSQFRKHPHFNVRYRCQCFWLSLVNKEFWWLLLTLYMSIFPPDLPPTLLFHYSPVPFVLSCTLLSRVTVHFCS